MDPLHQIGSSHGEGIKELYNSDGGSNLARNRCDGIHQKAAVGTKLELLPHGFRSRSRRYHQRPRNIGQAEQSLTTKAQSRRGIYVVKGLDLGRGVLHCHVRTGLCRNSTTIVRHFNYIQSLIEQTNCHKTKG